MGGAERMPETTLEQALTGGLELLKNGRLDDAEAAFREIESLSPGQPDVLHFLGMIALRRGRNEEAIGLLTKAIATNASIAAYHLALGVALLSSGRPDEGMAELRRAIALRPDDVDAYRNLTKALLGKGRFGDAVVAARKVISLRPEDGGAHAALGLALKHCGQFDESESAYRRALELRPGDVIAANDLASIQITQGRCAEAVQCLGRAVALAPGEAWLRCNLIYAMLMDETRTAPTILAACRAWDEQFGRPAGAIAAHANDRSPDRRLRVGYVSANFRRDTVGWNLVPLLANHDHEALEVFCYSAAKSSDDLTDRFKSWADEWRDISAASHEQAAELVRADRIDILVDLGLYTAGNPLVIFSRRPAPVQATFVGYPGTTGMSAMDYRLTDPYLDPPGKHDADYSEQSIRLRNTFWCFDAAADKAIADVIPSALPAASAGHVTFGCLNNFCKATDASLALWARVMAAVPTSRLLLMAPPGAARKRVLDRLGARGISANRIEFADRQPRPEYLRLFHRVDIGLDTIPYNGHTTGLESLWMGVPMVTRTGATVVSRGGLSQLSNLGLSELAAESDEQFVEIASQLAGDLPRLAELRAGLRGRMERSPLMDGKGFARDVEAAYREMWRRWCVR